MKNFFRAFQWKAQYYWTLLREWANQGRPRWAYSILLACALALTGCGNEAAPTEQPYYKHQYVALRLAADAAKIDEYMTSGWTSVGFETYGQWDVFVILKKPLPVEVAKSKNGARK